MTRPTQADIARALGLSPATVALVVGNSNSGLRQRLSAKTVRRIKEKAEELGYSPHRGAQLMRKGRSNLIVLLNFSNHSELTDRKTFEFGRRVHEAGFDFQVIDSFFWPGEANRLVGQIQSLRPEGVAITGSVQNDFGPSHVKKLLQFGIPLASMGGTFPGVPSVSYDGYASFRALTDWCLDHHRRRLVMVVNPESQSTQVRDRVAAFRDAVQARTGHPPDILDGLAAPTKLRQHNGIFSAILNHRARNLLFEPFRNGMDVMEALAHWREKPDALLGINDFFSIGALTTCSRLGISVPGELMISGFDNLSYATQGAVSLTSVEQPLPAMCEALMELLQAQIHQKSTPRTLPPKRVLPCQVIWRESTAAPRQTLAQSSVSSPPDSQ